MASHPQVNRRHPEYTAMESRWLRSRTFAEGRDAVKAQGTIYLPQPGGLDDDDYADFLTRAPFYGATGAALDMLTGVMVRKPPVAECLEVPVPGLPGGETFAENIDSNGTSIEAFINMVAEEFVLTGRVGVLTEHTKEEATNPRAYLSAYPAETIINWYAPTENGIEKLQWVVLEEVYSEPNASDPYKLEEKTRWRVLALDELGEYTQTVFVRNGGGGRYKAISVEKPTINGKPLAEIPFVIYGPHGNTWVVHPPPIMPIVDLNWDWYMRAADLAHTMHMTSCPMPWAAAAGLSPTMADANGRPVSIRMGSSRLLTLPEGGKVGMLEFTGAAAQAAREVLQDLEMQMAQLGVAMLSPEKRQPEVAMSMRIRISTRTVKLQRLAKVMNNGLTTNAWWLLKWSGFSDAQCNEALVGINEDFLDIPLEPQEMEALLELHTKNKLPLEVLFWNLNHGERIPPGWTYDDYVTALKTDLKNKQVGLDLLPGDDKPKEAPPKAPPVAPKAPAGDKPKEPAAK